MAIYTLDYCLASESRHVWGKKANRLKIQCTDLLLSLGRLMSVCCAQRTYRKRTKAGGETPIFYEQTYNL